MVAEEELSNFYVDEKGRLVSEICKRKYEVIGIRDNLTFVTKPIENE